MFIAYFLLFVILNGKLNAEIATFGAAFAALLYAFSCKFLGYSVKKDLRIVHGIYSGVAYLYMLVVEILKANMTVMRMILTKDFEPEPQLVTFDSGLSEAGHRVVLADSITLTPGTITCDLQGDTFTVHCLDKEQMADIDNTCFAQKLLAMEARREEKKRTGALQKEDKIQPEAENTANISADDGAEPETPEDSEDTVKSSEHVSDDNMGDTISGDVSTNFSEENLNPDEVVLADGPVDDETQGSDMEKAEEALE